MKRAVLMSGLRDWLQRLFASSLIVAIPVAALANGGPVAWSSASGAGDVGPVSESRVQLVSEDLKIKLDSDGKHFHVSATYQLKNDGPPIKVPYGVPLFWYPPDLGDEDDGSVRKLTTAKELAYPKGVAIKVGGRPYPCQMKGVHITKATSEDGTDRVDAWCVATIEVPTGDSVPLTLNYLGSYEFVDMAYSKSPFTEFDARQFHYALSPASYWAGHPNFNVTIDTGRWNDFFGITSPQGFDTHGALRTYHVVSADLRALGTIAGTLQARPVLMSDERMHYKVDHPYDARASSEHGASGNVTYSPRNVLDGSERTAWCAAAGVEPAGQWIEVSSGPFEVPAYCDLHGYIVVPGYAKSQQTWLDNNRIKTIRLGPCDSTSNGTVVQLKQLDRADTAATDVRPYSGHELEMSSSSTSETSDASKEDQKKGVVGLCTRLTIMDVIPGKTGDTCIAKFKPVLNCG
jgi:hypothetical protein